MMQYAKHNKDGNRGMIALLHVRFSKHDYCSTSTKSSVAL